MQNAAHGANILHSLINFDLINKSFQDGKLATSDILGLRSSDAERAFETHIQCNDVNLISSNKATPLNREEVETLHEIREFAADGSHNKKVFDNLVINRFLEIGRKNALDLLFITDMLGGLNLLRQPAEGLSSITKNISKFKHDKLSEANKWLLKLFAQVLKARPSKIRPSLVIKNKTLFDSQTSNPENVRKLAQVFLKFYNDQVPYSYQSSPGYRASFSFMNKIEKHLDNRLTRHYQVRGYTREEISQALLLVMITTHIKPNSQVPLSDNDLQVPLFDKLFENEQVPDRGRLLNDIAYANSYFGLDRWNKIPLDQNFNDMIKKYRESLEAKLGEKDIELTLKQKSRLDHLTAEASNINNIRVNGLESDTEVGRPYRMKGVVHNPPDSFDGWGDHNPEVHRRG